MAHDRGERESDQQPPDTASVPLPPPAVYARLRAAIDGEAAPPVARWPGRRSSLGPTLALVGLAVLGLDLLVRGTPLLRVDASFGSELGLVSALGMFALALCTTELAVAHGPDGLGTGVGSMRAAVLALGPLSLLLQLALVTAAPVPSPPSMPHPYGLPCFAIGTTIAALCLLLLVCVLRHSVPVAVGWRSGLLATAAGSWAGLSLLLHCPFTDLHHIVVGHWPASLISAALAWFVARRQLAL